MDRETYATGPHLYPISRKNCCSYSFGGYWLVVAAGGVRVSWIRVWIQKLQITNEKVPERRFHVRMDTYVKKTSTAAVPQQLQYQQQSRANSSGAVGKISVGIYELRTQNVKFISRSCRVAVAGHVCVVDRGVNVTDGKVNEHNTNGSIKPPQHRHRLLSYPTLAAHLTSPPTHTPLSYTSARTH